MTIIFVMTIMLDILKVVIKINIGVIRMMNRFNSPIKIPMERTGQRIFFSKDFMQDSNFKCLQLKLMKTWRVLKYTNTWKIKLEN